MSNGGNHELIGEVANRVGLVLQKQGKVSAVDVARKLTGMSLSAAVAAVNKLESSVPPGRLFEIDELIRSRVLVALVSNGEDAAKSILATEARLTEAETHQQLLAIMAPYARSAFATGHGFSVGPRRPLHPDAEADIKMLSAQAATREAPISMVKLYRAATGASFSEAVKAVTAMGRRPTDSAAHNVPIRD